MSNYQKRSIEKSKIFNDLEVKKQELHETLKEPSGLMQWFNDFEKMLEVKPTNNDKQIFIKP